MLKIDGTNITLTRGDTLVLTVGMKKNGQPYVLQEGDKVRFAVSIGHKGDAGYKLIQAVDVDSEMNVTMSSADTEKLTKPMYCFDVELTYADGTVDTFISGNLFMVGESE